MSIQKRSQINSWQKLRLLLLQQNKKNKVKKIRNYTALSLFKIIALRILQLNKFLLEVVLFQVFFGLNDFVLMMAKAFVSLVLRALLLLLGRRGPGHCAFSGRSRCRRRTADGRHQWKEGAASLTSSLTRDQPCDLGQGLAWNAGTQTVSHH